MTTTMQALDTAVEMLCRVSFRDFLIERVKVKAPLGETVLFEPWPHLMDLAGEWEGGESQVVLKARQVGISWLVAAYMVWKARYNPGATVLALSQGQSESYELLGKCRHIAGHLSGVRLRVDSAGELGFAGGGRILALPATQRAGRGYTASLVVADEAAFHPFARSNYAAYQPALAGGGQLLMVSTANGSIGLFPDLYHASKRGDTGYGARFISWRSRPGCDTDEWLEGQRAQFVGLPDEFRAEHPADDIEAFVALTGLVYPQFRRERHVKADPCLWEDCIARYAGYDLGGGDPTAVTVLGLYRRNDGIRAVHQFGEYYRATGAPTIDELYGYLGRWHQRARFDWIEPDPVGSAAAVSASLKAMGLPVLSKPVVRDKGVRLGVQAMYLDQDMLTFSPKCEASLHEFEGYRWPEHVDPNSKERYKTSTPVDHHGDAMDARGQALVRIYYQEMRNSAPNSGLTSVPLRTRTGTAVLPKRRRHDR